MSKNRYHSTKEEDAGGHNWQDEVAQFRQSVVTEMLVLARSIEHATDQRTDIGKVVVGLGRNLQKESAKERRELQGLIDRLEGELDPGVTSSASDRDVVRGMRAPGKSPGEAAGPRPIAGDSG